MGGGGLVAQRALFVVSGALLHSPAYHFLNAGLLLLLGGRGGGSLSLPHEGRRTSYACLFV